MPPQQRQMRQRNHRSLKAPRAVMQLLPIRRHHQRWIGRLKHHRRRPLRKRPRLQEPHALGERPRYQRQCPLLIPTSPCRTSPLQYPTLHWPTLLCPTLLYPTLYTETWKKGRSRTLELRRNLPHRRATQQEQLPL